MHGPALNGVLCRRAGEPAHVNFLRLGHAGREVMRVTSLSSRRLEGMAHKPGVVRLEDDRTGVRFEREAGSDGQRVGGPLVSLPAEFAQVALKGLVDSNFVQGYYSPGFQPFYPEPTGKRIRFGHGPIDRNQTQPAPQPAGLQIIYNRMDQLSLYQRVTANMMKSESVDYNSEAFRPLFWKYLDLLLPLLSVGIPGARCYYSGRNVPPGELTAAPDSAEGLLRERVVFADDLLFHFTPTSGKIKALLTPGS